MTLPWRFSLMVVLAAGLGLGCNKDEQAIRTYDAPKDQPAPAVAASQLPADAAALNDRSLVQWTLPAGWKQVGGAASMRFATIRILPDDPKAVLTVVPLPLAAQQLEANLVRWAGQLKLPTNGDLHRFVSHLTIAGEPADVVDMTGPAPAGGAPQAILAALVPHERFMWYFKIEAPKAVIDDQKANFAGFVQSLKFGGPESSPPPEQPSSPEIASSTPGISKFTAPQGWEQQPNSNSMRVLTFRAGPADNAAEMVVSRLDAGGFGSWKDNVERWRGQVGLEPIGDVSSIKPESVQVGDNPAQLFDFSNPQNGQQILVGYLVRGKDAWFFKLTGKAEAVAAQKSAFVQFLKSIQFE